MWQILEVCVIKLHGQLLTTEIKCTAKKRKEKKRKNLFKIILSGIISIVYLKNLFLFCFAIMLYQLTHNSLWLTFSVTQLSDLL